MKPKVYLAGKIDGYNDWRETAVAGHYAMSSCGSLVNFDEDESSYRTKHWSHHEKADLVTVGPYYVGCNHACPRHLGINSISGCSSIDNSGHTDDNTWQAREMAASLAINSIKYADLVFVWMSDSTAHGTLVEIGVAFALGKPIYLATPGCPNPHVNCPDHESWFPRALEGVISVPRDDPRSSLVWAIEDWATSQIAFDSPVEKQFWDAHTDAGRPIADLTTQHETTANGNRYRLDFYSPSKSCAIEVERSRLPQRAGLVHPGP